MGSPTGFALAGPSKGDPTPALPSALRAQGRGEGIAVEAAPTGSSSCPPQDVQLHT